MAYKWSMYRVIVKGYDGSFRVWASFALEIDADVFCERLKETRPTWYPRVIHPDSKLSEQK